MEILKKKLINFDTKITSKIDLKNDVKNDLKFLKKYLSKISLGFFQNSPKNQKSVKNESILKKNKKNFSPLENPDRCWLF